MRWLIPLVGVCFPLGSAAQGLVDVYDRSGGADERRDVPVTWGQVFEPGVIPAGTGVGGRLPDSSVIPIQMDGKTRHPDGSIRHAVLSAVLPRLTSQVRLTLRQSPAPLGESLTSQQLLARGFDCTVTVAIAGGQSYSASAAAALLQGGSRWLEGPIASEWITWSPLRDAGGNEHPHLHARFEIRTYAGVQRARIGITVENNWATAVAPQGYEYDLRVSVSGSGDALLRANVPHYRQSRWRRVRWWGEAPQALAVPDSSDLMATGAVPTYDPNIRLADWVVDNMISEFGADDGLMGIGALSAYMPGGGGRLEIAPLPRFAARYLINNDPRAMEVVLGYGEQAGSWPMHFRDPDSGLPLRIDDYPQITIVGTGSTPPTCRECGSPYLPEVAHHPSLAYLPYLLSGDYFFLEELQFWATWVMIHGSSGRRNGAEGLLVAEQVRGQAWGLRTLGQAAYATPDDHPLKSYFVGKLQNNISYFSREWLDSNPLGYITNTGAASWLRLEQWISTWMDDFLTWTFGHLVQLGFHEALPLLRWKARFPVGRMTHPDMCWILASTYWPTVMDDVYLGGSGQPVDTWDAWRRNLIWSWNDNAFVQSNQIPGREQDLIDASCDSPQMAEILGTPQGVMVGYWGYEGYAANLQPAIAVAIEAGTAGGESAFRTYVNSPSYPDYSIEPQWAIVAGPSVPQAQSPSPPAPPSGLKVF